MINIDLFNELQSLTKQLQVSLKQLRTNGIELAKCERDYKVAVNKKALQLRSEDMPVTLIQTVIYGYDDIAMLRFKRDSAKVVYDANNEAIMTIKLQMRLLENQIQREYSSNLQD